MSEPHKTTTVVENGDLQPSFVCGNKSLLSDSSLKALIALSEVLKPIYVRMKKDGYGMIDGRLIKQNENE